MRRFLPAAVIALLALAVATPANAGYLIIRVILEGGGSSGSGGGFGSSGMSSSAMKPGRGNGGYGGSGSSSPRPPGGFGGSSQGPPSPAGSGGVPSGPGASSGDSSASQEDPTRSLVVVVPVEEDLNVPHAFYEKKGSNHFTNPIWKPKVHVNHRGQRFSTNLFTDNATVQLYEALIQTPSPRRTRTNEVLDIHSQWAKTKSDSKVLFGALTAALDAGLIDEAVTYADELLAFATDKPGDLPPEVSAFTEAYTGMQKGIKAVPPKPNAAEQWRLRFRAQGVKTQSHYSLLYWDAGESEVARRLAMLEENFKGFYLWHATRGIALPIPDAPLLVVLPKTGGEMIRFARALDAPARLTADGYYSVEHDLLLLSPERLDDVGQTFARQAQQIYQAGIKRDSFLRGEGPHLHINELNGGKKPEEVARMQTLALVDRLVEDAATMTTVSREGSRQLLYHTGRFPRYVELPEWLSHGGSSFFTRPKDPAFIQNADGKWSIAAAMWTGYGGPNYVLQRYFKDLQEKKELHTDHGQLLKNILTDAYFRGLRDPKDAVDPDPIKPDAKPISVAGGSHPGGGTRPPPTGGGSSGFGGFSGGTGGNSYGGSGSSSPRPPSPGGGSMAGGGFAGGGFAGGGFTGSAQQPPEPQEDPRAVQLRKKRDRLSIKAESTAWALYYYLAKARPNELRKFLDEIAAVPRDLPLDGDTVVAAFCRVFSIENTKESLTRFADGWLDYIHTVPQASQDVALIEPQPPSSSSSGPPGLPGTPPGGTP